MEYKRESEMRHELEHRWQKMQRDMRVESDEDKLENMDIKVIEKFLRNKKLKNLKDV